MAKSDTKKKNQNEIADEEMTVELTLDDGNVTCAVVSQSVLSRNDSRLAFHIKPRDQNVAQRPLRPKREDASLRTERSA